MATSTARRRSGRGKTATTLTEIPPAPVVPSSTAMATSPARRRSGRGKTATILTENPTAPVVRCSTPMATSTARRRSSRGKTASTLTEIPPAPVVHSSTPMATSSARCRSGRRTAATTLTEIPDHLVSEIFLRLPAAEDLARASAACVSFHRLVTDKFFLRRFRRLHDPPLLAFYDRNGFHHALPPHPSAPAASALAASADFSFSFFPNHHQWAVRDIRDGRVLLIRPAGGKQPQVSMDLAVCDPLHRGYVLIPPVPDDLAASLAHPTTAHKPWCEAFLIPLEEEAEAAFSVMWMVHFATRLAAFVFSSTTGQWQAAASKGWDELFLERGETTMVSPIDRDFYGRHYAYGCFYWESTKRQKKELLVLDTQRMEFSISDLPPREWLPLGLAIVEAGEGRLGLFGVFGGALAGQHDLCYYSKGSKCESSSQWQLEKTISLGSGCGSDIKAAAGRYLLLGKFGALRFRGSTPHLPDLEYFSVDVRTLQLERVCTKSSGFAHSKTWIYTNFPPSLSSPTI